MKAIGANDTYPKATIINCLDILDIEVDDKTLEVTTYRDYLITTYSRVCDSNLEALEMAEKLSSKIGVEAKIPLRIAIGMEFKTRSSTQGSA